MVCSHCTGTGLETGQGSGMGSMGCNVYYTEMSTMVQNSNREQHTLFSIVPVPFPVPVPV